MNYALSKGILLSKLRFLSILIQAAALLQLSACALPLANAPKKQSSAGPSVLIVTAHPDDESAMAASVFKITQGLNGVCDLALITNGEGGYKYSLLAENLYGLNLTNEKIGRANLPRIRKKELRAGGRYIGIRNYYFFEQIDHEYTKDEDIVLNSVWDTVFIKSKLNSILKAGRYDYVFTLLPSPETHGHHKAASILALEAVSELNEAERPTILAVSVSEKQDKKQSFSGLPDRPITAVSDGMPIARFDRTSTFGYKNRLNYKIIVNWLIAEHKSQGTMQLAAGRGDLEQFWFYSLNNSSRKKAVIKLFEKLNISPFPNPAN